MSFQRKPRRSTSNSQRPLRFEPLENRALLAAGLMGHTGEVVERPLSSPNHVEVLLSRPLVSKASAEHVAADTVFQRNNEIPKYAQSPSEQIRIAEPLFNVARNELAVSARAELIAFRPSQLRDVQIQPTRIAATIDSRIEELRGATSDRPVADSPFINRVVSVHQFYGGRPLRDLTLADRDAVFAGFAPRAQAVVSLVSPVANVARSTSAVDDRLQILGPAIIVDRALSIKWTIPLSELSTTTINGVSAELSKGGSIVDTRRGDGGMVELNTLEQLGGTSKRSGTKHQASESQWQIYQQTIDKIVEKSASHSQGDSRSKDSVVAIERSREGGLVAIDATPLPVMFTKGLSDRSDIQLDPNLGRFRSFQIAAAPGHDLPQNTSGETLVSFNTPVSYPEQESSVGDETAPNFALLDSPVAYASVALVGAMVVMVEARGRKYPELKVCAGR